MKPAYQMLNTYEFTHRTQMERRKTEMGISIEFRLNVCVHVINLGFRFLWYTMVCGRVCVCVQAMYLCMRVSVRVSWYEFKVCHNNITVVRWCVHIRNGKFSFSSHLGIAFVVYHSINVIFIFIFFNWHRTNKNRGNRGSMTTKRENNRK